MNLIQKISKRVIEFAEAELDIIAVYLLGSIISGNIRPDSDIDIAVMLKQGTEKTLLNRAFISGDLSYDLGRTVDVGIISSQNLVYAREALLKGLCSICEIKIHMTLFRQIYWECIFNLIMIGEKF